MLLHPIPNILRGETYCAPEVIGREFPARVRGRRSPATAGYVHNLNETRESSLISIVASGWVGFADFLLPRSLLVPTPNPNQRPARCCRAAPHVRNNEGLEGEISEGVNQR